MATIVDETEAEGPGHRWALWVQGCTIQCPGCCNPEMFRPDRGTPMSVDELATRLERARPSVEGISVLGGEPFEQATGVLAVARIAKRLGLTVMVYSGYTLGELRERAATEPAAAALLAEIDLLVDGRYDRDRPEPPPPIGRRWIGSTNQTVHYLSDAYSPADPRMHDANTVEVHWRDGKLLINGWPAGAEALSRIRKR